MVSDATADPPGESMRTTIAYYLSASTSNKVSLALTDSSLYAARMAAVTCSDPIWRFLEEGFPTPLTMSGKRSQRQEQIAEVQ